MKNKIIYLLLSILFVSLSLSKTAAQVTNKIQADSVKIYQVGNHSAELIIENSTKTRTNGVLQNIGNGRTKFEYVVDSSWVQDSILYIRRGPVTSQYNLKSAVPGDGVGSFNTRYSVTKGTGDSAQLVGDTSIAIPSDRLVYTIDPVTGRRHYDIVVPDTAKTVEILKAGAVDNIAALKSSKLYLKGITKIWTRGYYAVGDGGNACYHWISTSHKTVDDAFIYVPTGYDTTNAGRYELVVDGQTVNMKQIGAKPGGLSFDNRPMLKNALASSYPNIYFPGTQINDNAHDGTSTYYVFNDSVHINRQVNLYGDGKEKSPLCFPNGIGFYLEGSSNYSEVHDLEFIGKIGGYGAAGYNSNTKHGIYLKSNSRIFRCVISSFDGDGLNVQAAVESGTNANNAVVSYNRFVYNGRNGFCVSTASTDANQLEIAHNDATLNKRWGFVDSSFLGNIYISNHSASNGVLESAGKTSVVHGGYVWYSIKDSNVNVEPGIDAGYDTYWERSTSTGLSDTWDSTLVYWTGGGYSSNQLNQIGVFLGNYTEGDDSHSKSLVNYNNLILGGSLAGEGQVPGAIAPRQGITTTRAFQVLYQDTSRAQGFRRYANATTNFDGGYDYNRALLQGWQFQSDDNGGVLLLSTGLQSSGPLWYLTQSYAQSLRGSNFGRSTTALGSNMSTYGELWLRQGFFGGGSGNRNRFVEYGNAAPTTGYHGVGDWVYSNSGDTTYVGWTCTVEGDPGTWVKIKSSNAIAGVGLSPSDTTGKWITSLYRRGDSVFYVKGGVETFSYLDSLGSGGSLSGLNTNYIPYNTSSTTLGNTTTSWNSSTKIFQVGDAYPNMIKQMVVNYEGSGGYGTRGIKQVDQNNGFTSVWQTITGNNPYFTDGSGTAVQIANGLYNSNDGSTLGFSTGYWIWSGGTMRFGGYTGSGNRIAYLNSSGDLQRGTIDPANITTGRKVDTLYRTPGNDSIIFYISGVRYAIKDSTGGSSGASPIQILNKQYTPVDNSGSGNSTLYTFTIPANTLVSDGDEIEIELIAKYASSGGTSANTIINGFGVSANSNTGINNRASYHKMTVTRTGTTTATVVTEAAIFTDTTVVVTEAEVTGLDFTTTNTVSAVGNGSASSQVTGKRFTVTYYHYTP